MKRSRNLSIRHTGRVVGGLEAVRPAPVGDPVQHLRVLGDDRDRHVLAGVVAGDGRDGLVVAEEDQDGVLVAVALAATGSRLVTEYWMDLRYSVRTWSGSFQTSVGSLPWPS